MIHKTLLSISACALFLPAALASGPPATAPATAPSFPGFDLVYPNYRGLVFPEDGDIEVAVKPGSNLRAMNLDGLVMELLLKGPDGKTIRRKASDGPFMHLPVAGLSPGPITLVAWVLNTANQTPVVEQRWPLRVLSREQARSLKVYIDRHNNAIVDGKPFFPLGWYGAPNEKHIEELADSPFNCLLAYGTNCQPKATMLHLLDTMHEHGLKLIYCMDDVYPTAKYFDGKNWEGITGNQAITDAVIKAYRDHPAILAWYVNDELPPTLVPQLEEYYRGYQSTDPNHPCFIVQHRADLLHCFPTTTDVLGVDAYPVPVNPLTEVVERTDLACQAGNGHMPVWVVPQAFAWYQYNSKDPNRGHTPTAEELRTGRAPTREEARCMTYLALTHGAKGLIYYCYYDLRVLPQYEEMWAWMKRLGSEVKTLSPVLLAGEDLKLAAIAPADSPLHTRLLRHDGKLYLLAVNPGKEAIRATFELPRPAGGACRVLFEDRSLKTQATQLEDAFEPLQAHVYEISLSAGGSQ